MFGYDVSVLENFSFNSIRDVFALIAQNYQVKTNYDIESFHYKSDYLNENECYKIIPQSLIEKYRTEYLEGKIRYNHTVEGVPYGILSKKYNQLLNERKKFTQINGYTKSLMDQKLKKGNADKVQDVNYTNSYYPYAGISEIADLSMYRRLRSDPHDMSIHMVMLILEASDFPLKMTLEFEKGSVLDKKYTPIFNSIPSIYEQLIYYFSIEYITAKTYILKILKRDQYVYKTLIHGNIKFKDFKEIVNSLGAEIKISFTPEIINTYDSYKILVNEVFENVQKAILETDKNIIESQIINSIVKKNPELAIAESLIELEQMLNH